MPSEWDSADTTWPGTLPGDEAPAALPSDLDSVLLAIGRARVDLDRSKADLDLLAETPIQRPEHIVSAARLAVVRMGHALMLAQHLGLSIKAWELGDPGRVRAEALAALQRAHLLAHRVDAVHRQGLLVGTVLGAAGALLLVAAVAGVVLAVG